jgi:hypothetical protein
MIRIGDTVVSDELLTERFVCDLGRCKGACCVEGESGAPLQRDELETMKAVYPKVRPYMTPEGIRAVETQGVYTVDGDGDDVTPLIGDKGACAYAVMDGEVASCAIERAHRDGKIDFKKPVSCHLYPVRITPYRQYDAVNYHSWSVCAPACELGQALKVPVYKFVKEALVRKYGRKWFGELKRLADNMQKKKVS